MDTAQYYDPEDTICAISSPAGTGAIALVRVSGPEAVETVDKLWKGRKLASVSSHTAHLGYLEDPDSHETLDQAVATVFRGPNSFTGEDIVELSIHGSRWIQRQLVSQLTKHGARLALPGEFTRRAFASGKLDLAEAEAIADVISASSRAAHSIAINQMRGDFSRHLEQLRGELVDLASLLELELDFSEEDVEFASRSNLLELAGKVHDELSRLAASFDAGAAIKDGVPIAIIGPTNAGKSSLLNTLLGDERAIVSDIHGTTRDIVEDTLEIGPYLLRLRDTAGLRETADTIEGLGIDRSRKAARSASIVLFVIDPQRLPTRNEIATELDGLDLRRVLFIINKTDIYASEAQEAALLLGKMYPEATKLCISARKGTGIDELREQMISKIEELNPGHDADFIVTNARHACALKAAADSAAAVAEGLRANLAADLIAQDLRETIHHLSTISGQITTTEILNTIFGRFCIGK